MAEEPSAKRHHGEPSDKSSNLVDVHVPGEKREYRRTLITHKYRGSIIVLSISKSVEPNEEQKEMISGFQQGILCKHWVTDSFVIR